MSALPALSVVMSVYNGAEHLQEALDSLAAQTFDDFEAVIIDDGSSDVTPELLARAASRDRRIQLLRLERGGLARALNTGIERARAPLVARHDADDRSMPARFAQQVAFLREHPSVAVVGSGAVAIDAAGGRIRELTNPVGSAAVKQALFSMRATPVHGAVMFRKSAVTEVGGYRAAFQASQDLDLWLRIAERFEIDNLPDVLYAWRVHQAGVFAASRATQLMYAGVAMTLAFERSTTGSEAYPELEACAGDLAKFSRGYRFRGRLEEWWGELLFRGLDDPGAARPHLRAALAAGQFSPRTLGLYGWSLLGLHWPGGATLQPPAPRT